MWAFGVRPGKSGDRRSYTGAGRLAIAVGSMVLVSGCGDATTGLSAPPVSDVGPESLPSTPGAPPEGSQSEATAGFKETLSRNLNSLAAEFPQPESEQVLRVFVSSGADEESVEVSIDVTPTGLEVDAVTGATPIEGACVFGHVANGAATVTELPLLSDGTCFIGDQR